MVRNLTAEGFKGVDIPEEWEDGNLPPLDRVRIWKSDDNGDGSFPWHLDGVWFLPQRRFALTYDVLDFQTHAEAVAAVPGFIRRRGQVA